MSVFGAMTTAVGGLSALSKSLGHISDNIANSQTIGYKRVETSFQTLVTQSSSSGHSPGGVRARPDFTNGVQGNISQTQTATNMAISGNGFFQVSRGEEVGGNVNFNSQAYFTRAGDFSLDKNGFLRNSAGYYLNGWTLQPGSNQIVKGTPQPIRIQQLIDNPTATSSINLQANLPLTPKADQTLAPIEVPIIDRNGETRSVTMNWRKQGTDQWRLQIDAPGSSIQPTSGTLAGQPQSFGTPLELSQNTTPQRQVSLVTLTPGGTAPNEIEDGKAYSITLNGKTFSYTAQSFDTSESVMGNLVNQVNASGSFSDYSLEILDSDASNPNSTMRLRVTGPSDGSAFTLASTTTATTGSSMATNAAPSGATAQVSTFTFNDLSPGAGDTYSLSINGHTFSYTVTATDNLRTEDIATKLANQANEAFANDQSLAGFHLSVSGDTAGTDNDPVTISVTGPSTGAAFTAASSASITTATPTAAVAEASGFGLANAVPGIKQQVFLPLNGVVGDVGDVFTIPFGGDGQGVSYTTDGTEQSMETIATRLAALVNGNADSPYTAKVSGAGLVLTRRTYTNPPMATNAGLGPSRDEASTFPSAQNGFGTTDGRTPAHLSVTFGEGGVLQSLSSGNRGAGNATVSPTQNANDPAYVTFTVDYGNGPQEVRLNLGQFGSSVNGLTQFAGSDVEVFNKTQDGFTRGTFRDLTVLSSGEVVANYDNGRSRVLAQVPIVQVNNVDGLQKVDGNAWVPTTESGAQRLTAAGENGSGNLVVSSTEGSNVDIADEFTKLIVTQRAYSANTRVVNASDQMLQDVLNLSR
ncbi:flagellar hook-basal body complex protein [Oleisolibacter albus]|uniref:flagellar hook-basal body complex protein n=1 Tax=Oleisolibacter albus TaxID=2171757 RepID=UPI000DF1B597|nr:flagellar hook-basal body complex protein [Oleisolibacter albus]